jgi:1,4-alpha-glucan branching enzyme
VLIVLTDHDIYLFREGTHGRLYAGLGCQLGRDGAAFGVCAQRCACR